MATPTAQDVLMWALINRARLDPAGDFVASADFTFAPFTTALGAIMVPPKSPIKTLGDLKGKRLGVAGGPLDKSWLLLVAYALRTANLDLRTETTQEFGAPPLLNERAKQGELDAVLDFWPYAARLEALPAFRSITQVFKSLPDLVVSGINKGWNLGDDVTYSGTVAGALEAALLGVPGIAVSVRATRGDYDFGPASQVAATMAEAILRHPLPARTFLKARALYRCTLCIRWYALA